VSFAVILLNGIFDGGVGVRVIDQVKIQAEHSPRGSRRYPSEMKTLLKNYSLGVR
jgi:hypothetical protein